MVSLSKKNILYASLSVIGLVSAAYFYSGSQVSPAERTKLIPTSHQQVQFSTQEKMIEESEQSPLQPQPSSETHLPKDILHSYSIADIASYYFECNPYILRKQGENVGFTEEYIPYGRSEEIEKISQKICSKRGDEFLRYLRDQGLETVLETTQNLYQSLSPIAWGRKPLFDALKRMGDETAILALLAMNTEPDITHFNEWSLPDNVKHADSLIECCFPHKEKVIEVYLPYFYSHPSSTGLAFIAKHFPEESEAIARDFIASGDPRLHAVLLDHGYWYFPLVDEEVLWEWYAQTNEPLLKVRILNQIGVNREEAGAEVEQLYVAGNFETRKKIIDIVKDHGEWREFLVEAFFTAKDLEEMVLLGDLSRHQLLERKGSFTHRNFKSYLLEKARLAEKEPLELSAGIIGPSCKVYYSMRKVVCRRSWLEEIEE